MTENRAFIGNIILRPERLSIPLKRKKPAVYAVWNDLFHEDVSFQFQLQAWLVTERLHRHKFILLTKRPKKMVYFYNTLHRRPPELSGLRVLDNIYNGLTVCNQQEMESKCSTFVMVPGKKFLSLEPLLSKVIIPPYVIEKQLLSLVVLGGETGPGARPMHPDWVRSVRDQCQAAGVPFFLKYANKKDGRVLDGRTHDDLPWIKQGALI